jgi:hypothetical protein
MLCVWSLRAADRLPNRLSYHEWSALNTCLRLGWIDKHASGPHSLISIDQLQRELGRDGDISVVTSFLKSDALAYGWQCMVDEDGRSYRCEPTSKV